MVGRGLFTGPILPSPNVLTPHPQHWASHLRKLLLISRRRRSRLFHLLSRYLQDHQRLHLIRPPSYLRKGDV